MLVTTTDKEEESQLRPSDKMGEKSVKESDEAGAVEVGKVQDEDEGDILEEDLNDDEYIPYSKKKGPGGGSSKQLRGGNKGKGGQKK